MIDKLKCAVSEKIDSAGIETKEKPDISLKRIYLCPRLSGNDIIGFTVEIRIKVNGVSSIKLMEHIEKELGNIIIEEKNVMAKGMKSCLCGGVIVTQATYSIYAKPLCAYETALYFYPLRYGCFVV